MIVAIRIDVPPTGIEVTGEGTNPTDAQMKQEMEARQKFLDQVAPTLAALPSRPLRRAGNVTRVELLGSDVWAHLNHYLLLVSVDIGDPGIDLASLLPPGSDFAVIGEYAPLESWPANDANT
jgi:hypothetical protein